MNNEQFLELIEVLIRIAEALEDTAPRVKDAWRNDPATDKQKSFMAPHRIPFSEPMTKGQASDLIDGHFKNKNRG